MRQAIALFVVIAALLGLAKQPAPVPSDSQRSEPVTPASSGSLGPAELPLVAKLLPGGTVEPSASDAPPVPKDGELSPGGQWRWSKSQWAWVPVKQPGPAWHQNGHSATVDHLVNEHGIDPAIASKLTAAQRDVAHSNAHNAERRSTQTYQSGCPGGRCPSPSSSRGFRLFRR